MAVLISGLDQSSQHTLRINSLCPKESQRSKKKVPIKIQGSTGGSRSFLFYYKGLDLIIYKYDNDSIIVILSLILSHLLPKKRKGTMCPNLSTSCISHVTLVP